MAPRISRGDIWTAAGGSGYVGKPRPVVILQDDRFEHTASVTICPLTTNPAEVPLVRPVVTPDESNGLRVPCRLMADKITTIPKSGLGARIGRLAPSVMAELDRAVLVFLGFSGKESR